MRDQLGLDFPNLPYLIDGDVKLTGAFAISKYLANEYAPYLAGDTIEEKVQIEVLYEQIWQIKKEVTGPCYLGGDRDKLTIHAKQKMKPLIQVLGKKNFLIGDKLTLIDFYMGELCEFVQWLTYNQLYEENAIVESYVQRIKKIP